MGYNATVVVLTDRLDEIENDPKFGAKLAEAIRHHMNHGSCNDVRAPYVTGQTQVVEVHHSSGQVVVTVGGNCGRVLGYGGGYAASGDEIIRSLERERREKARAAKAKPAA